MKVLLDLKKTPKGQQAEKLAQTFRNSKRKAKAEEKKETKLDKLSSAMQSTDASRLQQRGAPEYSRPQKGPAGPESGDGQRDNFAANL